MKKLVFSIGTVLTLGIFTAGFSNPASAATQSEISNEKEVIEIDPIGKLIGSQDGNDGKAELHLEKLTNSLTSVSTKWYD